MTAPRRLALITGGTSGIGLGAAKALAARFDLALVYFSDTAKAEAAKAALAASGARVETYQKPLAAHADAKALVEQVTADFGRGPDVLVNSAGKIRDGLYMGLPFEEHQALIQEHLVVTMSLAHLVLKGMNRERFGRIVNLSSISARFAKRGQANYAAAKAGIEGFTRTLALEVAHRGITVNAVAPGLIETPMTQAIVAKLTEADGDLRKRIPAGRTGTPEEVGALIAFLCSDDAAYITGQTLVIDGGRSLGDSAS
jgi:3-oxoacyl-[acyl-carrier protein] reductase